MDIVASMMYFSDSNECYTTAHKRYAMKLRFEKQSSLVHLPFCVV